MTNYQEKDLESFIESYLLKNNAYIKRVSQNYDKDLCFDKELLISFLESTQSKALDELKRRLGEGYKDEVLKHIASKITKQGIVKSLQNGIEIRGIKLSLAYRKPSNSLNSDSIENYNKNTLSIIRQLYYSKENQNSIDIVIFLNGVPLLSIELKNPLTGQNVYNAIEQYKKNRDPKEKLLQNCIVHFALDCDLAFMTTRLEGEKTRFLPFNRGLNNGSGEIALQIGAGNPSGDGIKTAYFWERILKKDTLLTLIFNFVKAMKSKEDKQEKIIFPRYHQFDVVEKLLNDAKENGVGQRYLIEHSAGSGKSNSIAWLAHNLVGLYRDVSGVILGTTEQRFNATILPHSEAQAKEIAIKSKKPNSYYEAYSTPHSELCSSKESKKDSMRDVSPLPQHNKVLRYSEDFTSTHYSKQSQESYKELFSKPIFDSVIVVTDRKVLDSQIRDNVKSFEGVGGVVEAITQGSKHLRIALEEGKKIVVTTIQKFPYILDEITILKSKTFAIIIDEAHSSQSGISAQKLGEVIRDRDNLDTGLQSQIDDKIIEIIKNKKLQPNASYFAFTATPKPKTLEMFGKSSSINGVEKFIPFHLYSMKQAIEEGFILDILKHYTTYKSYYNLIASIKDDDPRYDKKKALKKLKAYAKNHTKSIAKKTEIMVEHFFTHSYKKIGAKAKAMVVTKSRTSAIKYYFAFTEYLDKHYPKFKAIIAFSGEINMDGEIYSESKINGFSESIVKQRFKQDNYRFLIVAEKYQTGFDEPLLHTMYVDKQLSGVSAVQTLSRLNRTCKNKEDTFVLDFANTHEEISQAFSVFYGQTYLAESSDPQRIFDLKSNLLEYGIYTQDEIDSFVESILKKEKENIIHSKLDRMRDRFIQKSNDEKTAFYNKAKTYLKDYGFLAQILPYEDIELEKLSIVLKKLIYKIIPPRSEDLATGILSNVSLDSYRVQLIKTESIILESNGELMSSKADGLSKMPEAELDELSNIIKEFNTKHGKLERDNVIKKTLHNIKDSILQDKDFTKNIKYSDAQNVRIAFEEILKKKFSEAMLTNSEACVFLNDAEFKWRVTQWLFNGVLNAMNVSKLHDIV